ncbi:MAG: IS1595 family transposase [Verrucomicrobia bacterium]|nr:IS1595 family transposase [Verrucomicrobiota bacterium]
MEDYPRTLMELERRFSDEARCRGYLFALRWPQGFVCPACGGCGAAIRRDLWRCEQCGRETSVMAGTVFQDSKLPLTIWFRAMWQVTSQKNGISALGLQRVLGLGSYKTAWMLLHKLRRAMVRPGRERLRGEVEVDEAYWGGKESGVRGRQTEDKALIAVAAEADGESIGRIRLRHIPNTDRATLHGFIQQSIEPGSTVVTDGLQAYRELDGYVHDRQIQKHQPTDAEHLLPRVHRVISLLKRWLLGTHQGGIAHEYLEDYLNEFTFRFNRRRSTSRGKLFYRLAQQAVQVSPVPFDSLTQHKG